MKGTIVKCLKDLIEEKFGKDQWTEISRKSGFTQGFINITADIDDSIVMSLLENTCSVLEISLPEAADAFGDYWVNDYAPRIYKSVYGRFSNAREFILGLNTVHSQVTADIPNAQPPELEYESIDDKTLIVTYKSKRELVDVFVGLAKGLGRYYQEALQVVKLDDTTVRIVFE